MDRQTYSASNSEEEEQENILSISNACNECNRSLIFHHLYQAMPRHRRRCRAVPSPPDFSFRCGFSESEILTKMRAVLCNLSLLVIHFSSGSLSPRETAALPLIRIHPVRFAPFSSLLVRMAFENCANRTAYHISCFAKIFKRAFTK